MTLTQPPSDEVAEMAVIGAILLEPSALGDLDPALAPEDFYLGRHQALWRLMLAVAGRGDPPDALLVYREAEKRGLLEAIGGRGYPAELAGAVGSTAHVGHHARIVWDRARARALLALAGQIQAGVSAGQDSAACIQTAQDGLYALSSSGAGKGARHISDALYAVLGALEGKQAAGLVVRTGWGPLDDLLGGGLRAGEFYLMAGRPGMGKTSAALGLSLAAAKAGHPVLIASLEMSGEALAGNLLSSESGVVGERLRKGRRHLGEEGMGLVSAASGVLGNLPIWLLDSARTSISSLRAEARRRMAREGLDLLVVDYIGLIEGGGKGGSRQEDVSEISRGLKVLARDLGRPVLALAQLNRQVEAREGHRPRLADLRESGSLEQDADAVMLLYRPYYYTRNEIERDTLEVIVAKNRYGPPDTVRLAFEAETYRVRERGLS